jgi:4-aminobutyrate aminotransferase
VRPDVVLFAKGIASGLPLGGIIAERSVLERWPVATHGSTFGGNPVSCAAALATLDVLDDEGLYERCRTAGE